MSKAWFGLSGLVVLVVAAGTTLMATKHTAADSRKASDPRIETLAKQYQGQKLRLDAINEEIVLAEKRALDAKREAKFQQCQSELASIDSEVQLRRAECAAEIAEAQICRAENEATVGKGGVLGCFGGLAMAVLSSGAAAPWALGGCAGGLALGDAATKECRRPKCESNPDRIEEEVLSSRGLHHAPSCGGYAGIMLSRAEGTYQGVALKKVTPGGPAHRAGMAPGDVLVSVNAESVPECAAIKDALAKVDETSPIQLRFVRDGVLYAGRSGLTQREARLGVSCGNARQATHSIGTRIDWVDPDSPAAGAGVTVGDVVKAVYDGTSGHKLTTSDAPGPKEVARAIGKLRAGAAAKLTVVRNDKALQLSVVLVPREDSATR